MIATQLVALLLRFEEQLALVVIKLYGNSTKFSSDININVDLSTFEMDFVGATQHRGNGVATYEANYIQKYIFHVILLH